MNVSLDFKLHANQKAIDESNALYKVIKSGKRFGKTRWAIYALTRAAGLHPGGVFWYIAPTYRQAKSIAWREFKNLIPIKYIRRMVENDLLIELVNGASIQLIGADNPDSLRGPKLHGVVFDEAAYTDKYVWPLIRGQLLGAEGAKSGFAWFISSPINPVEAVGKEDWYTAFYQEAVRKQHIGDKNWQAWHFTIYDNPTLSKEQIDEIKSDCSDDVFNVEYMANESAHSGTIVSEFDYSKHVKEWPVDKSWKLVRGIDWGIQHPTACLWAYINERLQMVYFCDEFEKSDLVIQESCGVIKNITGGREVEWSVIDPSMNKRDKNNPNRKELDEFNRNGVWVTPGDNRDRGYDIMKMFFKKDMVRIHPKCRLFINQLRTVQYGQKTGEDLEDVCRYILVRVHDLMFGGNLFPKDEAVKREPNVFNLNDSLFTKKSDPKEMSWAFAEEDAA